MTPSWAGTLSHPADFSMLSISPNERERLRVFKDDEAEILPCERLQCGDDFLLVLRCNHPGLLQLRKLKLRLRGDGISLRGANLRSSDLGLQLRSREPLGFRDLHCLGRFGLGAVIWTVDSVRYSSSSRSLAAVTRPDR